MSINSFDLAILTALQKDGRRTNAELSELVNLSPSQCSRRRSALEAKGLIRGYTARLDAGALGLTLKAITRVSLKEHNESAAQTFAAFVDEQPEIRAAYSTSGDSDYVLEVETRDLAAFAEFLHSRLMVHPDVGQLHTDIVLKSIKSRRDLPLELVSGQET